MNIPEYWAEVRIQTRKRGRQVTVRRWGWSSESAAAAREHAQQRADDALERILKGEGLPRREAKLAYGDPGLPIREEVLARVDDLVITRNAYGAHCLNAPNVLFADIDYAPPGTGCLWIALGGLGTAVAVLAGKPPALAYELVFVLVVVALFAGGTVAWLLFSATVANPQRVRTRERRRAEGRIRAFAASHPDWLLRVYETPNGFRVLVAHRTFEPNESAVTELFDALSTDPLYRRLCDRQQCFRARLTAKPWRMGLRPFRPRPGVWPVTDPEKLAARQAWVKEYERCRADYAACRYLHSLGEGTPDESVARVVRLHDERSGALTERPLA